MSDIRFSTSKKSFTVFIPVYVGKDRRRFYDMDRMADTLPNAVDHVIEDETDAFYASKASFVGIQQVKLVAEGPVILADTKPAKREKPTLRLYVRPAKPKSWWPMKSGKPVEVGVLADGIGWIVGDGDLLDVAGVVCAAENIGDEFTKPQFRVVGPAADQARAVARLNEVL